MCNVYINLSTLSHQSTMLRTCHPSSSAQINASKASDYLFLANVDIVTLKAVTMGSDRL
jgi:hypothetical protein